MMFVVAEDGKKGLSPTSTIWIKKTPTETGYFWPRYGLHFKLKNYVSLPVDPSTLKNEWRYVPCSILLNGKTFKTFLSAEKAILKILNVEKSKKGSKNDLTNVRDAKEVEAYKVEANQVEEVVADEVVADEVVADEVVANEVVPDEVAADGVVADEVAAVEGEGEENKVEKIAAGRERQEEENGAASEDIVKEYEVETDSKDDDSFGYLPIMNSPNFNANELLLKRKAGLIQLEAFYLKINENSERKFVDKCVDKTFSESFFLTDITFKKDSKRKKETDWIGVFDETELYTCMKNAMVEKLKLKDTDDTDLKKILVRNFDRIKRAMRARP